MARSCRSRLGVARIGAAVHREHGVESRLDATIAEIIGADGRASGVRLGDGSLVEADTIIVGVGITPNTDLAEAAGLTIDNGVLVDEHLATSDPDVFAAGDVANVYYPHLGTHLRLEHWSAALNQGPVAAAGMLGRDASYDQVPYFFSDQYDMGMEYSGYVGPDGYDGVTFRGDVDTGEYLAFWMRAGRVLAGRWTPPSSSTPTSHSPKSTPTRGPEQLRDRNHPHHPDKHQPEWHGRDAGRPMSRCTTATSERHGTRTGIVQ